MAPDMMTTVLSEVAAGIIAAVPRIITALIFLVIAYIGVKIILRVVRAVLRRTFPNELVARLAATVTGIFLWFAVFLMFLSILGLNEIAASLGTATAFVALGISYAMSDMIEDAVAGIYLLRDPDFTPGDTVTINDTTATVKTIELRKTRLTLEDGNTLIMANKDVEQRWVKETSA